MFWRSVKEDKFHSSRDFIEGCSGLQKYSRPLGYLRLSASPYNYSEIPSGLNLREKLVAGKNYV